MARSGSTTGSDPHTTPAMRQFHRFKQQQPGCVLFFRMGDFYEMFYEDAELAHKVLGVTLTERTRGIPMAGVPYHSVENYLRRMIQAGHRVAVCDQIQDAAEAKAAGQVVERDVTRVITPGTLTDESLLTDGQQNPLAAIVFPDPATRDDTTPLALAWCELSTGTFQLAAITADQARDELARIAPSELLYIETPDGEPPTPLRHLTTGLPALLSPRPAWQFRPAEAVTVLCRQYGVATLSGFGFDASDPVLTAAGGLLHYLLETQRTTDTGQLVHLRPPKRFERTAHMVIDATSLRSLEVEATLRAGATDGSLLAVLGSGPGRCHTAMGKRLMRQWLCYPLCDRNAIEARQRIVRALVDDSRFLEELRDAIAGIQDIERITARLAVGRATPRDLVALGRSAGRVRQLQTVLADRPPCADTHDSIARLADDLTGLATELTEACIDDPPAHLRAGGLIRDGFDAELDQARELQRDSHTWLARYQQQLTEATGIPSLKVGYNKIFGYYIEVTAAQKHRAQAHLDSPEGRTWTRKQTLKNAERYITPDLKTFEGKVLSAESRGIAREQALFQQLCTTACGLMTPLHAYADTVARLDVLAAFAGRAARHGYVQPQIVDHPELRIDAGRHPVLDHLLGDRFVPNDLTLGPPKPADPPPPGPAVPPSSNPSQATLALITGPNMAGKSTYIRQAALITLLAHTGSFVPADAAVIGLTDRIFTRIGASDELHTGQSTFMVEMTETANLCHHATARSLIILDEIGRGTSTLDGLSLAWAIAEHIAHTGARCLFATHYHELTTLAERLPAVTNLHVTVREWQDQVVFLHRIVPGATDRSYGIHVARIAGLPPAVIDRANRLLAELTVRHEHQAPASAGPSPAPPDQLPLFTEIIDHPALTTLRDLDLDSLSPLAAFDHLRTLQAQLHAPATTDTGHRDRKTS